MYSTVVWKLVAIAVRPCCIFVYRCNVLFCSLLRVNDAFYQDVFMVLTYSVAAAYRGIVAEMLLLMSEEKLRLVY